MEVEMYLERYERRFMREFLQCVLLFAVIYIGWNFVVVKDLDRHNENITASINRLGRAVEFDHLAQYHHT